jgi:hypothetical protein
VEAEFGVQKADKTTQTKTYDKVSPGHVFDA